MVCSLCSAGTFYYSHFTKNTMVRAIIKVKDRFSSYTEFEEVLTEYKKKKQQEFWIRDARTISYQRKRFPETVSKVNEDLKYYYVRLSCVKGGRKFKTKNENSTRKRSTLRQDCPASIILKISPCQQSLVVVKINESHRHSTSKTALTFKSHITPEKVICYPETTQNTAKETEKSFQILKNDLKAPLTSHKKFSVMDGYGKRMAQLSSEVSTKAFHERVNFIRKVIEMWEEGKDLVLNENFSRIFEKRQDTSVHCEKDSVSQKPASLIDVDSKKSIGKQSSCNDEKLAESVTNEQLNVNRNLMPRNVAKRGRPKGFGNTVNLKDIRIPRNVAERGRPKVFGNTVIGLKESQKSMKIKTKYRIRSTNKAETEQCLKEEYPDEYLEETTPCTNNAETEQCLKDEYLDEYEEETTPCTNNAETEEYLKDEYLDEYQEERTPCTNNAATEQFLEVEYLEEEYLDDQGLEIIGI